MGSFRSLVRKAIRGGKLRALLTLRVLAGHSKLDITQRYVHANAADLTAAIAKLPGN
jgi:hypothetical protein